MRYSRLNRDAHGYTQEEDRYLLWLCREVGFGEWRRMRRRVERDEEFGFDHFLLSKTEQEIDRRVNLLLREIQRHNDPEHSKKSKSKGGKKKEDGAAAAAAAAAAAVTAAATQAAAASSAVLDGSAAGAGKSKRKSESSSASSSHQAKRRR